MNLSWDQSVFDQNTLEFVFPGNYRQKVYSQLVTLDNKVVGLNPKVIPPDLKAQAIAYTLSRE